MALKPASTLVFASRAPIVEKGGIASFSFVHLLQEWDTKLRNGLDLIGQTLKISPTATIGGRAGTLTTALQHIDSAGILSSSAISGTLPHGTLPSASIGAIGGVQAINPVPNQWVNSIDTSGLPQTSQPGFGNIAGTVGAAQLPAPTVGTLGGVEANAPAAHQWLNAINASGVPQLSQPAFADISGNLTTSQLPVAGASNTVPLAKITGLGTDGSLTVTNGLITAIVLPT